MRIPSLDGLRAISITLVMMFHLVGGPAFASVGNLGVRVFFVISGYLITGLLLKELDATGGISLKRFYARRALRIFPAFYTYLAVVAVCAAAGLIAVNRFDLLQAGTYSINYFPSRLHSLYVRHIWSLSVEEQFYLLSPGLLWLLGRRGSLVLAGGFIFAAPLIRLVYWIFVPGMHEVMDRRFETVADALATGCVLAGIQQWLARRNGYNHFLRSPVFYVIPAVILLDTVFVSPHPRPFYGAGITVLNVCIALCIDRWVRYPDGITGAVLNSPPLRAIGILSYSIYLWQEPFLDHDGTAVYNIFPLNLLLVAAFAMISFFFIERPFQRLKSRVSQPRAVAARDPTGMRH